MEDNKSLKTSYIEPTTKISAPKKVEFDEKKL
jgi:hypothetical protein